LSGSQSTVEYGLLIATVAILVLLGARLFGDVVYDWMSRLVQRLTLGT
jgi:Flp pilus assembly pilin Flp